MSAVAITLFGATVVKSSCECGREGVSQTLLRWVRGCVTDIVEVGGRVCQILLRWVGEVYIGIYSSVLCIKRKGDNYIHHFE